MSKAPILASRQVQSGEKGARWRRARTPLPSASGMTPVTAHSSRLFAVTCVKPKGIGCCSCTMADHDLIRRDKQDQEAAEEPVMRTSVREYLLLYYTQTQG